MPTGIGDNDTARDEVVALNVVPVTTDRVRRFTVSNRLAPVVPPVAMLRFGMAPTMVGDANLVMNLILANQIMDALR